MTFELEFLDGKRAVPRQLLSYRWSGDVTAGCDGLRLHFLWDGDLPEVYRVRGFARTVRAASLVMRTSKS